jgi:hypothetical protein
MEEAVRVVRARRKWKCFIAVVLVFLVVSIGMDYYRFIHAPLEPLFWWQRLRFDAPGVWLSSEVALPISSLIPRVGDMRPGWELIHYSITIAIAVSSILIIWIVGETLIRYLTPNKHKPNKTRHSNRH